MDQIKIGKFIAYRRKKQGWSQKQLAEQIDVTDKTISKWETGGGITSSIGIFSMLNYTEQWGAMIAPALAQITLTFVYVAVEETVYAILLFQMKHMLLKK